MRRALVCLVVLAACSDAPAPKERPIEYGGTERPVQLDVPASFTEGQQYPLLVILHGYSANGFVQKAVFQAKGLLDGGKTFVLAPDGLIDSTGRQYWNADPACCDFDHTGVDDVAYIGGLIDSVMADWPIDPARVFVIGHSNGGFMSYRLACERADVIAGIGVLAGLATTLPCNPVHPVSVLHMHGTDDDSVPFTGAATSVSTWEGKDGCGSTMTAGPMLDIESTIAGSETSTGTADGCPAGIGIEEWTITGASHVPNFVPTYGAQLFDWLSAHPRVP